MKRFIALLKTWAQKLRNYISPVFLVLLAVSFTLWYISKLNYTYTTDFNIKVKVNGERLVVPCVVEGKGTPSLAMASMLRAVQLFRWRNSTTTLSRSLQHRRRVCRQIRLPRSIRCVSRLSQCKMLFRCVSVT